MATATKIKPAEQQSLQNPLPKLASGKQVQERLSEIAVATVRAIAADNQERMAGYKNNVHLLKSGVFYPNDYFMALESMDQVQRIDWFVKTGNLFHGIAPASHFVMQKDLQKPTGIRPLHFLLKPGAKPSEALAAIRQGLSLLSCGETCQIGYYEAIRGVLGTEKFDMLFAADSPTPLVIHADALDTPLEPLYIKTQPAQKIAKGQIVQISNVPHYPFKHINGEAGSYLTMCCDDTPDHQTFTTLGLRPEGMSHQEVKEKLLEEFNSKPIGMRIVTPEVAARISKSLPFPELCEDYANAGFTMDEFAQVGGGNINCTIELDAGKIAQLANSNFKNARALFTHWNKR